MSADPWREEEEKKSPQQSSDTSTDTDSTSQSDINLQLFPLHKRKKGPEINEKGNTDPNRDFFMAMAILTAERSKDPQRQVSQIILN